MSIDETIRAHARELLRAGMDPVKTAAKTLGADPDRYWLVVASESPMSVYGSFDGTRLELSHEPLAVGPEISTSPESWVLRSP